MVVVCGEAGVGKTALLRSFCDAVVGSQRVLWGTCDPLFTPPPFGPLFAIAEGTGGELGPALAQGANPHQVALALARELGSSPPTLLVLEDLHWADEATLDVFTLLVRRAEAAPALVVGTYRDDALENAHPLRRVLGELATTTAVRRLKLAPLSPDAVGQLAAPHGVDGRELYEKTGGNPFFVAEVLAGGSEEIPATVKDAVLARAMRLSPSARRAPRGGRGGAPTSRAVAARGPGGRRRRGPWTSASAPACWCRRTTGWCSGTSSPVSAWRARLAPGVKLACTLKPLQPSLVAQATLWTSPAWPTMPRRPGTPTLSSALLSPRRSEPARWAPTARRRPSTGGSSGSGPGCRSTQRADVLERRSHECYLTDQSDEAIAALQEALECRRALGDRLGEGRSLSRLGEILWCPGRAGESGRACCEAVAVLESLPASRELAKAYARLARSIADTDGWGKVGDLAERALQLAEDLGDTETALEARRIVACGLPERPVGGVGAGPRGRAEGWLG